jgi:DNA helicase-2/ATP-dependent DNA helicase PcrA
MEALDLSPVQPQAAQASAAEAIKRFAPPARMRRSEALAPLGAEELLSLSYFQVDDYLTCPLKYKYVHILKVPVLQHHTVAYGKAVHDTILDYYRHKLNKLTLGEDELIARFESHWINEGFLSREHEEQRFKSGAAALRRFYRNEEKTKKLPVYVEKEFTFTIGQDRIKGRWDRIDIDGDAVTIIDFKTSQVNKQKDAHKRARESLQLDIYALAYKEVFGKIPDRVELHFLESGLVGGVIKEERDLESVIEKIQQASQGIRQRRFAARPRYLACQYCAYRRICPHAK